MLPSGTVTFLFTDIEGSTSLAQWFPSELPLLLERHHAIIRQAIETYHGYIFQVIGDAFGVAFHTAQDALGAALEAQRMLQAEEWHPAPIRVRMGLHTGAAQAIANNSFQRDYEGYFTIARTQRVMSVAHGGQVLLSNPTAELARGDLPVGVTLRDMGQHRLKSLLNLEHLWQMVVPGLQQDFPPLQSLNAIPNNLPVQLTSFIGRETEIAHVEQELAEHRLVTLTGSGGTGKTRLALQVAADLLDQFDHGVWFVELGPLVDPELIPQTVLSVIGVREQPGRDPLDVLKEYLQGKKTLVLLDNCEHLIEDSARVANGLLKVAAHLKILATSREALRVKGEVSYQVPPLSLPSPEHLPAIEQLSQYEAVRLFIDRASIVSPNFEVTTDNAPAIAQICYHLDGIPLAIELAASRARMMSVEQISGRLDNRFRLLTGGARTALPHHQTLRALIDWSHDLLSDSERRLLRRLSVFAGSWLLEAAEEVCSGDGIEPDQVLDLLTKLVDKSLVNVMTTSQSGETRYRMLETIHQYAHEKLLDEGGGETLRQRHLAYFVRLVEQAEPELYRSNQLYWSNRLEDELDNFRIALEWALATDVESGLRIAVLPWRLWQARDYFQEMGEWLAQLLNNYQKTDTLHAQALAIYANYIFRQRNFSESIRIAELSLQMAHTLSDQQTEAFSSSFLGLISTLQGNVREGARFLEQSLALYRALGDKIGQATTMWWLAVNHSNMERATALIRESLELYRELGHLSGIISTLASLARLTMWSGDLSSPVPWLEEALSISRQLGDQSAEEEVTIIFGTLAYWQSDYQQASAYYEEAIRLSEKIGEHFHNHWAHIFMAYVNLRQGAIQKARRLFEDYIGRSQKAGFTIAMVFAVEGLASLTVNQDEPERAATLIAWADGTRKKIGDRRPPIEQASVDSDIEIIRSQLDDTAFENASKTGRSLTQEQAIEYALQGIRG